MKTKFLLSISLIAVSVSVTEAAQPSLESTRNTLSEWVETRKIISKEKSDWLIEESILNDTQKLLQAEVERLDQDLSTLEETSTSADEARSKLTEQRDDLTAATKVVVDEIIELETQMKMILPTLPKPLVEKIKPLIRRLPEDSQDTSLSMGERVQNIVGILSQADKFNTTITANSESKEIASGKIVEVRTLYWGLSMAYYVDASGEYAGIGYPKNDGWEWPEIEGAGPAIRKLLDVYEGGEEIQFVSVPARIN